MSADASVVTAMPGRKLGLGEVVIKGRVQAARRFDGNVYTRLVLPAASEYEKPQVVQVRGKGKLGDRDEVVTVVCRVGGYARKPYDVTDKETGEVSKVTPVDITLDAVE